MLMTPLPLTPSASFLSTREVIPAPVRTNRETAARWESSRRTADTRELDNDDIIRDERTREARRSSDEDTDRLEQDQAEKARFDEILNRLLGQSGPLQTSAVSQKNDATRLVTDRRIPTGPISTHSRQAVGGNANRTIPGIAGSLEQLSSPPTDSQIGEQGTSIVSTGLGEALAPQARSGQAVDPASISRGVNSGVSLTDQKLATTSSIASAQQGIEVESPSEQALVDSRAVNLVDQSNATQSGLPETPRATLASELSEFSLSPGSFSDPTSAQTVSREAGAFEATTGLLTGAVSDLRSKADADNSPSIAAGDESARHHSITTDATMPVTSDLEAGSRPGSSHSADTLVEQPGRALSGEWKGSSPAAFNATGAATATSLGILTESVMTEFRQPLSHQVSQAIYDQVQRQAAPADRSLTLRLDPPELGELVIRLSKQDNGIAVRVSAREPVTMDMLLARGQEIETQLKARDVDLAGIEFLAMDDAAAGGFDRQSSGGAFGNSSEAAELPDGRMTGSRHRSPQAGGIRTESATRRITTDRVSVLA